MDIELLGLSFVFLQKLTRKGEGLEEYFKCFFCGIVVQAIDVLV